MRYNEIPSLDLLCQIIRYDSNTGNLFWKSKTPEMFNDGKQTKEHKCNMWNAKHSGKIAGCKTDKKYITITINEKMYMAHRIAYSIYHNEKLPTDVEIDHANGIHDDNRIFNLRKATGSQNRQNVDVRSNNTSGFTGVNWNKKFNKWFATINANKKYYFLGSYKIKEDAIKARKIAEKKYFGDYARK